MGGRILFGQLVKLRSLLLRRRHGFQPDRLGQLLVRPRRHRAQLRDYCVYMRTITNEYGYTYTQDWGQGDGYFGGKC